MYAQIRGKSHWMTGKRGKYCRFCVVKRDSSYTWNCANSQEMTIGLFMEMVTFEWL